MPVGQLAALARRWYRGRLAPDGRPRTRDESQALLTAAGLTAPFWALPAAEE